MSDKEDRKSLDDASAKVVEYIYSDMHVSRER